MNWFKLSLQLNRFPISRAQKTLQKIQEISSEKYESYLNDRKAEIVNHHLQNNAFYKDFSKEDSYTTWTKLPIMTKKDLQRGLQKRLSTGFSRNNIYLGKTSGSSGTPFIFAKDRFAHALTWAVFQERYLWHGIDLNKSIQARFYGIPMDFYGNIQERFKDRISLRRRFPVFNLSEKTMKDFLRRFQHSDFDYINGYTSAILLFAKFLNEKKLNLKKVCPSLKLCIVTSEVLFETDKNLMQKAFGVPVINEYGASEVGLIAFENKENEWLVNAEDLFVEIVDKNNNPLPYGEEGRILVTSLYNKAHPVIRYEIGDTGILSKKSTPKRPILQNLTGRNNDFAKLKNGKIIPGLTFYYVTKSIIEDTGSIKEFVVVQTGLDTFEIIYVSSSELSSNQQKEILKAISRYVDKDLEIIFDRKDQLQRTKSGKLKQFVSKI
ncbi:phenylacetate-CoA ligase [Salegentibacter echinorum]|uniref:Phenylacetate-CoA ligase n=1 Tax=Salegentibacter echinorum TaxID=1073325 RepID=A0A1M5DW03_SALEC|nr:phenylacetate--CoA ligase family protein [Salegentibacter echinorum]SHF71167.1 phenylacetate-CoA ligase [Salegentibacter echinorum]